MPLSKKNLKKIEKETKELFKEMGFDVRLTSCSQEDDTVFVNVKSSEPRVLIGKRGEALRAAQRILRVILLRELDTHFYLQLDINGYKEKKIQYLCEIANEIADEVALSQKPEPLVPMCAYERRVIHMELSERADVTTESEGEEPKRRVVVKPA